MRALLVLLMLTLAGCISEPETAAPVDDVALDDEPAAPDPFFASFTDCTEATGVSVYDRTTFAPYGPKAPWVLADIGDELGNPLIAALGNAAPLLPVTATGTTGHWHTSVECADGAWGWVGIRVEPPAWDTGGADRHLLLALWSLPPAGLLEGARAAGYGAQETEVSFVDWGEPSMMHQYLDDADHGAYETQGMVELLGNQEGRVTRYWMQDPLTFNQFDNPETWRPISFDAIDTPSEHWASHDSTTYFSHTQTTMHLGGGGYGNAAAVAYTGFDRTLRWGPSSNETFENYWHH